MLARPAADGTFCGTFIPYSLFDSPLVTAGLAPIRLYANRATLILLLLRTMVSDTMKSCSVALATLPIGRVVGGAIASVWLRR